VGVVFGGAPGQREAQIAVLVVLEGAAPRVLNGLLQDNNGIHSHTTEPFFIIQIPVWEWCQNNGG